MPTRKGKFGIGDAVALVGFGVFAVGLWWIYPPASLLFSGAALVAVGMLMPSPRR